MKYLKTFLKHCVPVFAVFLLVLTFAVPAFAAEPQYIIENEREFYRSFNGAYDDNETLRIGIVLHGPLVVTKDGVTTEYNVSRFYYYLGSNSILLGSAVDDPNLIEIVFPCVIDFSKAKMTMLSEADWNIINHISVPVMAVNGPLPDVFNVFHDVGDWIIDSLSNFTSIFINADGGLSIIGVLSVSVLAIAVVFLLLRFIRNLLVFRR